MIILILPIKTLMSIKNMTKDRQFLLKQRQKHQVRPMLGIYKKLTDIKANKARKF